MKMNQLIAAGILFLSAASCNVQPSTPMNIYWIDVEGGAATLIITPSGESILMDAGWATEDERDAKRIVAAMDDAGITKIDYFIASHFHSDHVNGLPALVKRIPIEQFIDHGNSVEQDRPGSLKAWESYIAVAQQGKRRTIVPGETLLLTGIDLTFVTSNREVLDQAMVNSSPNAHCENASPGKEDTGENASSVGYLLSLGAFDFLNLGDLTVDIQHKLACPTNLIGEIDLYQVPHHGNGIAPQLSWALSPTAAVLNNGPHKGGSPEGYEVISSIPDIKAIWQVHRALDTDDKHNSSAQMTANLTEENDAGYWIKATVQADGSSYLIENERNKYSETYQTK
jgi:competence protein ComEC